MSHHFPGFKSVVSFSQLYFWNIYNGVAKDTIQNVTIWKINYELLKTVYPHKKQRLQFISNLKQSLVNQEKLQHPNILQIYQISDPIPEFFFVTEPIIEHLHNIKSFTRDENIYIVQQIAILMNDLHNTFHLSYQSLTYNSIFFNSSFTLKVAPLFDSLKTDSKGNLIQKSNWHPSPLNILPCNCAPEILQNCNTTNQADVFMYGLVSLRLLTNAKTDTSSPEGIAALSSLISNVPAEFQQLLRHCLLTNPSSRPTFQMICQCPLFSSKISVLFQQVSKFAQLSLTELEEFVHNFLLYQTFFSSNIQLHMFLPLLIRSLIINPAFAPKTLPTVFSLSKELDDNRFNEIFINSLTPFLEESSEKSILYTFLEGMSIYIQKCIITHNEKFIFLIFQKSIMNPSVSSTGKSIFYNLYSSNIISNTVALSFIKFIIENNNNTINDEEGIKIIDFLFFILPLFTITFVIQSILPLLINLPLTHEISTRASDLLLNRIHYDEIDSSAFLNYCAPIFLHFATSTEIENQQRDELLNNVQNSINKFRKGDQTEKDITEQSNTEYDMFGQPVTQKPAQIQPGNEPLVTKPRQHTSNHRIRRTKTSSSLPQDIQFRGINPQSYFTELSQQKSNSNNDNNSDDGYHHHRHRSSRSSILQPSDSGSSKIRYRSSSSLQLPTTNIPSLLDLEFED